MSRRDARRAKMRRAQAAKTRRADTAPAADTADHAGASAPPPLPDALPDAFLVRMRAALGADGFSAFLAACGQPPARALLLNTLRGAGRDALPFPISDAHVPWEPNGFFFEETSENRPGRHPLHAAGAYYIQEPSAMLPARMLLRDPMLPARSDFLTVSAEPAPFAAERSVSADASGSSGLRVLDLCAAPGGKSIQLAMMLGGQGLLISNEIHPARAKILSQNIERMGIRNAVVLNETPERLAARFPAFFDRILVDAPCSGEGMFRKNPDAIREWSPEAVEMCAARQSGILDSAADMLAPGGRLVYATCTFAPAEDEEQIARFLARHPDFALVRQEKLLPHEIRGEGHFCAALVREGCAPSLSLPPAGAADIFSDKMLRAAVSDWIHALLRDPACLAFDSERLFLRGGRIYLLPPLCPALTGLHFLRPGLHLADRKSDRPDAPLIPAHALSHALLPADARLCAELSDADAAAYLSGQTLRADALPSLPGRIEAPDRSDARVPRRMRADASDSSRDILICCRGFALGWTRYGAGILKNHYPKGLRISA